MLKINHLIDNSIELERSRSKFHRILLSHTPSTRWWWWQPKLVICTMVQTFCCCCYCCCCVRVYEQLSMYNEWHRLIFVMSHKCQLCKVCKMYDGMCVCVCIANSFCVGCIFGISIKSFGNWIECRLVFVLVCVTVRKCVNRS